MSAPYSTTLFCDKHKQKYKSDIESYVRNLSITTAVEATKQLQSLAAYSSALCRSHHRQGKTKTTAPSWSPELELIRLNIAFLRTVLNVIQFARSHNQPWYVQLQYALRDWQKAHTVLVDRHAITDINRFGTAPHMWQHLHSLLDLEAQLVLAAQRCQALAITCRHHLFQKRLAAVASHVASALGRNKIKTVIAITGHKKKSMVDLSYVVTNHNIIIDPVEVHQTCTRHFQQHHSINSTSFPTIINWDSQDSVVSSKLQFDQHCQSHLPVDLHWTTDALWTGFTSPWTQVATAECARRVAAAKSSLSHCPSLSELRHAISHSPTTSPGVSGLSFSHIKLWTPPTIERVHHLLSLLWHDNHLIPDHWHWKLLCPIPKADKDPQVLDNLRPIMLVESLRKLWVGIIISRLSVFLTQEPILSTSQHGYVAHRSTVTSTLQLLDNIDDFSENRIDMYLSSWDFTKAFDSLPFSLSRLALQRAFIPSDIADWLLRLDIDGRIIVRTPYALDSLRRHQLKYFRPPSDTNSLSYFKAGGGVAQGDVHSPYVWRLFIDILLRALEYLRPQLAPFPTINTSDFGYADDIISLACTLLNLQQKADIVSAFSIITGISISWSKLRATCQEWSVHTHHPTLVVWDKTMVAHDVPLVRGQTIRHLGFQISTMGDSKHALETTSAALKISTDHLLRRTKWLPSEAVLKTAALRTVAQTTYATQLSTYTSSQLHTLDTSLFKLYRAATKHWPTFPSAMLHISYQHCGLGLPAISSVTYNAKHRILQRAMISSTLGDSIIHRYLRYHGVHPTLHNACTVPDPSARPGGASGYWLDNLLQHCNTCGLVLQRGGHHSNLSSETQLVNLLPSHRAYWIEEGLACLGDLYDPINRCWIHTPSHNIPSILPNIAQVIMHHSLRVGQCWRTSLASDEVYEILTIHSSDAIHARVWRLLQRDNRVGQPALELTSHHFGPISHAQLFASATAQRIYTHKDRLALNGTVTRRTIWHHQVQPTPTIMPLPAAPLVDSIMHEIYSHFYNQPINIYTDGSWKALGSGRDRALLFSTSSVGGGSLVIASSSQQWRDYPVLVYHIIDDGSSPTAHAYTWELMALAMASLIQSHYAHGCQLYSDCTSALQTIMHATPSSALLDTHAVLIYPIAQLATRPSAQHIAAHPEIHIGNTRPWTQHEWGIHIADLAASHIDDINQLSVAHILTTPVRSSQVLDAFKHLGTWTWCYKSNTPILLPIKSIWSQHTEHTYLQQRDQHHDPLASPASWQQRSWRLTSLVHQFKSSSTRKRARLQRILLHWSGIGVNLHRDQPQCADAFCPNCNVLESEYHLLRHCTDPQVQQLRAVATKQAAHYIAAHANTNPLAHFMLSLHASIDEHPHGHLMYFGFLTTTLATTLPTYDENDVLITQLKNTVVEYLRILSQGGLSIIDLVRARRHLVLPTPSPTPPASSTDRQPHNNHHLQRPTAIPRTAKPTSKRLKRLAHESGLADIHTKFIDRNHLITDYFKRPRPSSPQPAPPPVPPHDHATTHPP